ncbi:hypothetical protein Tco_0844297 [Tanacetum coccineum]
MVLILRIDRFRGVPLGNVLGPNTDGGLVSQVSRVEVSALLLKWVVALHSGDGSFAVFFRCEWLGVFFVRFVVGGIWLAGDFVFLGWNWDA